MGAVETSAATCCWCGAGLRRVGDGPWLCWTARCNERQHEWAVVEADRDRAGTITKIRRYLYCPTPVQVTWHEAVYEPSTTRLLVGGAAGPGKSRFIREALYRLCAQVPGLQALLIRKSYKDLEKSHLRFMPYEVKTRGGEYKAGKYEAVFTHPDGQESKIVCGHMEDANAVNNYLSAEFDVISPDELVTFDEDVMIELFTRARSSLPRLREVRGSAGLKLDGSLVLTATNPGGRGARWIKDFWIDKAPDQAKYPKYRPERWKFFGARLEDNPYIAEGYRETLEDLPESRRRQLLYGDWDVFDGQFFEWRAEHEGKPWHVRAVVQEPADLRGLTVGGGLDWGSASPGVYGFYVVLPDGRLHKFDEIKFQRQTVAEVAGQIRRKWAEWGVTTLPAAGADPALKAKTGQIGESIQQTFARHGVPLIMVSNDRLNGWQRVHEALRPHPDGQGPFFSVDPARCKYTARTMPLQVQDAHNPEDLDTDGDDHAADETRYALQRLWRPKGASVTREVTPPVNSWGWWRSYHERQEKPHGVLA